MTKKRRKKSVSRSKNQSEPSTILDSGGGVFFIPEEERDDARIGYAVESFLMTDEDAATDRRIKKRLAKECGVDPSEFSNDGWRVAYNRHHDGTSGRSIFELDILRATAFDGDVIVAIDSRRTLEWMEKTIRAYATSELYAEPVDETPIESGLRKPFSERDNVDGWLVVTATVAFQELFYDLLHIAIATARAAALVAARDVGVSPRKAYRKPPKALRPPTAKERDLVLKAFPKIMRQLLKQVVSDHSLARSVGRKAESERDHRAYCMRQRLVESETSDLAKLPKAQRFRVAKERVKAEIVGNCADSTWERIMKNGRQAHLRIVPSLPFCDEELRPTVN